MVDLSTELRPARNYPDPWYEQFCFHSEAEMAALAELVTRRDVPAVAVLAGEDGIGRGYRLEAVAHRLRRQGTRIEVMPCSLAGFEGQIEPFLAHLIRHRHPERIPEWDALKVSGGLITRFLSAAVNTNPFAAALSFLLETRQPLVGVFEYLQSVPPRAAGPQRGDEEVLRRVLTRLSADRRLILHLEDATAEPRPFLKQLLTLAFHKPGPHYPNLFLAFSCHPEVTDEEAVPRREMPQLALSPGKIQVHRFQVRSLHHDEVRRVIDDRLSPNDFPAEFYQAAARATTGQPRALALAFEELHQHGAVGRGGGDTWRLGPEGLENPALIQVFERSLLNPIEEYLRNHPRGDLLRDLLVRAVVCGPVVPLELVVESLGLPQSTRSHLIDAVDDDLTGAVEELHLFEEPQHDDPGFPKRWIYRFANPVLRFAWLDVVHPSEPRRVAELLLSFLHPRLLPRTRGAARLLLGLCHQLDEHSAIRGNLLRDLAWWATAEEADRLADALQSEVEGGLLDPEVLWSVATEANHWPPYRRLAVLDAYRRGGIPLNRTEEDHFWQAHLLRLCGRLREGLAEVQTAIAILRQGPGEPLKLSSRLRLEANLLVDLGRPLEALDANQEALEKEQSVSGERASLGRALADLGWIRAYIGQPLKARRLLERSLEVYKALYTREEHPGVAAALHSLGCVLWKQGDLAGARRCLERSLESKAAVYETEEHPSVAVSLFELGWVLLEQGDLAGAQERLERALEICRAMYGTEEHPNVAALLGMLAIVLLEQGDLAGAQERLERALEIQAAVYETEEHPLVARSLRDLGCVLLEQGDLAGAQERLERALEIQAAVYETEEHPLVARSLRELGRVRQEQGDLPGARGRLERALEIQAAVYETEEHPDVAPSLRALAMVLLEQGDLAGAQERLERALEIQAAVYETEEHPLVARSLRDLGCVLLEQGDLAGAQERLERALEIQAAVYETEEHPLVARSLRELGRVRQEQGDLPGARGRLERALEIQAAVYETDEHPDVAASLRALAMVLLEQGDLAGARERLKRALEIQEEVYGTEEHPEVARSLAKLAGVLHEEGETSTAIETLRNVLVIHTTIFADSDHPDTAIVESTLGILLLQTGETENALLLLRHALVVFQHKLGPGHPRTKSLQASLDNL